MFSAIGNFLTTLSNEHPALFCFVFLLLAIIAVVIIVLIYKIFDKKDKIDLKNLTAEKNSENKKETDKSIENPIENVENINLPTYPKELIVGLKNLVVDMQDLGFEKSEKLREERELLISEQASYFCSKLKSYRNFIRDSYKDLVGAENILDSKVRLFNYWFSNLFEDVDKEILIILKRNGLLEKSQEQLEDTLSNLYDTTFSKIIESITAAPDFIENPIQVKELLQETRVKYKDALQNSLNHAKSIRKDYEVKFQKIEKDFKNARDEILKRDFPGLDLEV